MEALEAIFGDEFREVGAADGGGFEVQVASALLRFWFGQDYPSHAPPRFELHAKDGKASKSNLQYIERQVRKIWDDDHLGEVVVYDWVECVRSRLGALA